MTSSGDATERSVEMLQSPTSQVFEIADISPTKKRWMLGLHSSHLSLHEAMETQPYILLREGYPKDFNYMPGLRALVVNKPIKATFKLQANEGESLFNWIGKGTMAGIFLRRRYGFILPLALIWMIAALPLPGNPAAGIGGKSFDMAAFGLGAFLVAAWAWARWRPSPALFLLDAAWFACLTARVVWQISQGRSRFLYLLVGLGVLMTITGVQHFGRFRKASIPRWRGW